MSKVNDGSTPGLPVELTTFVGRRRELGELRDVMAASPLVTLIGVRGPPMNSG